MGKMGCFLSAISMFLGALQSRLHENPLSALPKRLNEIVSAQKKEVP